MQRATAFAERHVERAFAMADAQGRIALGPWGVETHFLGGSMACRFALDGYLDAPHTAPASECGRLAVIQAPFAQVLGDVGWAKPWIERNSPIPWHITHPHRIFIDRILGLVYVLDTRSRFGAVILRDDDELDFRSLVAPFKVMLNWLARTQDAAMVHAACLAPEAGGVLVAGRSGSGKSTAALHWAARDLPMVSDDAVLLHEGIAYAIYTRAKISPDESSRVSARFRWSPVPHAPRGKATVDLRDLGTAFQTSTKTRLAVLPRLSRDLAWRAVPAPELEMEIFLDSAREVHGPSPFDFRAIRRGLAEVLGLRANIPLGSDQVVSAYNAVITEALAS